MASAPRERRAPARQHRATGGNPSHPRHPCPPQACPQSSNWLRFVKCTSSSYPRRVPSHHLCPQGVGQVRRRLPAAAMGSFRKLRIPTFALPNAPRSPAHPLGPTCPPWLIRRPLRSPQWLRLVKCTPLADALPIGFVSYSLSAPVPSLRCQSLPPRFVSIRVHSWFQTGFGFNSSRRRSGSMGAQTVSSGSRGIPCTRAATPRRCAAAP